MIRPCGVSYSRWHCKCDCGNETIVALKELRSGTTKSCGCSRRTTVNLEGQIFGELTVVERAYRDDICSNCVFWKCQCSCGKITTITSSRLINGEAKVCGWCSRKLGKSRLKDLTGMQFGDWTVIDRSEDYVSPSGYRATRWNCICSCGVKKPVSTQSLLKGMSRSCGCKKESKGEQAVSGLLDCLSINYTKQYTFDDLRGWRNGLLRFDFALFNDDQLIALIEYQGEQHYLKDDNKTFGLQQRKYTDKDKKEYCEKNNISLYEIRYDEDVEEKLITILEENNLLYEDTVPSEQSEIA